MVQEWLRVYPTLWETCMDVGFPLKMQVPSSMFVQFSHTDPYPINKPHTSALKTYCSQVPHRSTIGGHSCYLRPQPEGMVLRKKPGEDAPIPWRPEFDLFSAWGHEEEQHPRQWFSGHQNHPQTFACHINRKVLYNFFICKLHLKQLLQQTLHLPVMPCKNSFIFLLAALTQQLPIPTHGRIKLGASTKTAPGILSTDSNEVWVKIGYHLKKLDDYLSQNMTNQSVLCKGFDLTHPPKYLELGNLVSKFVNVWAMSKTFMVTLVVPIGW